MEGLKHVEKIREYCDYIEKHLLNVGKAWGMVQEACKDMNVISDDWLWGIIDTMIKQHDVSKMSPEEFIQYQQNFFPVGEKDSSRFADAWKHHLEHNPHHWENWTNRKETFPNEMACHCVCMVCDWIAMGIQFGDTAEEYYQNNMDDIVLPQWAVEFVREIFDRLRTT